MDFTLAHDNLSEIYLAKRFETGDVIIKRKNFNYKNHKINIFYTNPDEFTDMIRLMISNGKDILYIPFYFVQYDEKYNLTPYIPENAYKVLKKSLFIDDKFSPKPMFEKIRDILESDSINDYYKCSIREFDDNARYSTVKVNPEDYAYFHFLRSSNRVGETAKKRIRAHYSNPEKIIRALYKLHKTVVFTSNFNERKNLIAVIDEANNSIKL